MHKALFIPAAVLTLGLLSACGDGDNEPGPGGVSEGEAAALDEAAEIIEARRLPEEALPQVPGDNVPLPPEIPAEQDSESD